MTANEILDRLSKGYQTYLNGDVKPVGGYDDKFYDGVLWAFARLTEIQPSDDNVEYTFEEAFQKTICEQRLYCPQGEWIIDGHHRRCKKCGEYFCMTDREGNDIPSNFCPNCGAKMKGGAEE